MNEMALKTNDDAGVAQSSNREVMVSAVDLLARAIEKGMDIDTLERLIALRDREVDKVAADAFHAAMAQFQGQCPTIKKTKIVTNKDGKALYSYAPIDVIVEQVKDAISANGLSYQIKIEVIDGGVRAICIVHHLLGHTETSAMEVPIGGGTDIMSASQKTAAATTFAKRYAFCNAFGIMTGDEDTDAKASKDELVADAMITYGAKLREAKTLDEIEKVYSNLPAMAKKDLMQLFRDLRRQIIAADKPATT